ncbi:MAG: 2-oxoglutarate oxidoreductase, partial [Bacteroidales bacterium]
MNREDIVCPENLIYSKPDIMNENYMHYCPGCSHGVVHKIIAEVIKELGLQE